MPMASRYAPYAWSVLLHALLVALLGVSLHAPTPRPQPVAAEPDPIQARAVDEAQVAAEVQRLRDETRRQQQQEEARRRQLQDEAQQARETRQREEQRAAEARRRAEEEQRQRARAEQERKAKEAAEQKRLAELKQAQAEAEKKRVAEEKRAAELAAQRKKEEDARKKAAAEQELKTKMAEAQRQMEAEAQRRAQERARQNSTLTQRYVADIRNKVERNWLRPPTARPGMTCTVLVQQLPTGDVVGVRITRGSGDAVFDRSVENAVHKASPLPPPPVPEIWEREIEFIFEAR